MVSKSVCGKSQIEYIRENFGERAFRPERNFNVTVYDAIMVVTAEGLGGKGYFNQTFIENNMKNFLKMRF